MANAPAPPAAAPKMYTIESPNAPDEPGCGKPRRAAYMADQPELLGMIPGINSLHEMFLTGVKISSDKPYLGQRVKDENGNLGPYVWTTWGEVYQRVKGISAGLVKLGLLPQDPVGIFAINRPEWILAQQSCFMNAFVTVPLYDTLGDEALQHIVNQTDMRVCFATHDKAEKLVQVKSDLPTLTTIVVLNELPEAFVTDSKAHGVDVIALAELEQRGKDHPVEPTKPTPDDLAVVSYTSGTTGKPKGVMLTHRNLVCFTNSIEYLVKNGYLVSLSADDVHLSYLSLAHGFELVIQQLVCLYGARAGFYSGDTRTILNDIAELKPTVFLSVPRVLQRIYDAVVAGVKAKGAVAWWVFQTAIAQKKAAIARGRLTHPVWDKLVFASIRAKLGGRVKLMLTGSAPISNDVKDFLRCCFSCNVFEGYGQTETSAGVAVTWAGDYDAGHVGVPLACSEIKLRDIPEMDYTSNDKPYPRGEVCILCRGTNIFQGYFRNEEKTAETLDADGWCHSGDVGMWDAQGRLMVIDRIKDIFKLAQGEYIAPEKIENVYIKHELVAQAFVYGDSLQSALVGVIVPDKRPFLAWARSQGFATTGDESLEDVVKVEGVTAKLLAVLTVHVRQAGLKGFEVVKAIYLEPRHFAVENNLLTPTLKLRRIDARKRYRPEIDAMYASLTEQNA
ncbi:Long chain acyl-CoA synthetase 7 peroxisomal [Allomyces javanicus]|nr:Long chain acyl-CoA synthetase 7 peroxisomal [Allomyces javanicus]